MGACAADPATESVALQLESGLPPPADAMRAVAEGRPLTVLTLRDASGVSRSSAFLPARVGDVEPGLSAVSPGEAPVVVPVEVQNAEGVQLRPALVAARPVEATHGAATLVGGQVLDDAWVSRLARLTGARVELQGQGLTPAAAGSAEGRTVRRALPLGPAELTLAVGSAAVDETRATLLRALLTAGGLGLLLALGRASSSPGASLDRWRRSPRACARSRVARSTRAWRPRAAARCGCWWTRSTG